MPLTKALLAKTLRSSTFRLAILYVGLFSASVAGLFAYVYGSTAEYLRGRDDAGILAEERLLQSVFAAGGAPALAALVATRRGSAPDDDLYLVADAGFRPLAGTLATWPAAARGPDGWVEFRMPDQRPQDGPPPLLRAITATLPDGSHLLVARNIERTRRFTGVIGRGIAVGVALFGALAAIAGISVTRRTVSRIEAINATSRAIMASGLGERIPLRDTRDEWDQLAANLNSMLDRIEELVRGVKQVSDNIAHDLRTPLMRMRGRLEVALRRPRGEDDTVLLTRTVAELDDVLKTFASLLRISSVEARERKSGFAPVDLGKLCAEVADLFDAAAEERGGRVRFAGEQGVFVWGDRDLLFEALSNLVDNAVKHGGGEIEVRLAPSADRAATVLAVSDRGPGVPAGEQKRVFERFYRLERSRSTGGNGLGLSLVKAVAQLHGAGIALLDNEPGLKVELSFPALSAVSQPGFGAAEPTVSPPRHRGADVSDMPPAARA